MAASSTIAITIIIIIISISISICTWGYECEYMNI